jgi:hypothetical protein
MIPCSLNLHYDNHPQEKDDKLGSAGGQINASKVSYRTILKKTREMLCIFMLINSCQLVRKKSLPFQPATRDTARIRLTPLVFRNQLKASPYCKMLLLAVPSLYLFTK